LAIGETAFNPRHRLPVEKNVTTIVCDERPLIFISAERLMPGPSTHTTAQNSDTVHINPACIGNSLFAYGNIIHKNRIA
jgi:hypothetical protein